MKCDATMDDAARTERSGDTAGQARASVLRVIGLKKSYVTPQGRVAVLRGVDLSLEAGASVALMGESGSRLAARLERQVRLSAGVIEKP